MSSRIEKANKDYYSSKGKKIYSDFSTFAQGKCLATCNAIEFCKDFPSRQAPVVVCEYGVGKGDFARTFLDEVKKRNKKLYERTRYYLFDFSEKMLEAARKNLKQHHAICVFGKFDAAYDTPDIAFDYCRINELLTDLPAQFYMKQGMKSFELVPKDGDKFELKEAKFPLPTVTAFLSRVDEGRAMPFNFTAEKFLLALCAKGKENFRIDIFDYGFYSADEVFLMPVEDWNRLLMRNYGGQLTVDMNFPQLIASLSFQSIPALCEPQLKYAEGVLGKKLEMHQGRRGLDYVPSKSRDDIIEDDGFYHLRIGK